MCVIHVMRVIRVMCVMCVPRIYCTTHILFTPLSVLCCAVLCCAVLCCVIPLVRFICVCVFVLFVSSILPPELFDRFDLFDLL